MGLFYKILQAITEAEIRSTLSKYDAEEKAENLINEGTNELTD